MKEAEENKKWFLKQRFWAMALGFVGSILAVIPATTAIGTPMVVAAGLLGFKGMSDAQDRIENTTAKTEKVAESTARSLVDAPPC